MSIRVTCPGCGRNFEGPDDWAGRQARCPNCSTVIQIPAVSPSPPSKKHDLHVTMQSAPVEIEHCHQVRGAFKLGFGLTLGYIVATLVAAAVLWAVLYSVLAVLAHRQEESKSPTTSEPAGAVEVSADHPAASQSSPAGQTNTVLPQPSPPSLLSSDVFELESLTFRIAKGTDEEIKYAWEFTIRNTGHDHLEGTGEIRWLDVAGHTVATEKVPHLSIPVGQERKLSGITTIPMPQAEHVNSVTANVNLR